MATQPDDEPSVGRFLDAQLKAGERFAADDIVERYQWHLMRHVRGVRTRKNLYTVTEEDLEEAIFEAFAGYVTKPSRYDPARGKSLLGYLKMAAERDLYNLVDRHRRASRRDVPLEDERRNSEVAIFQGFEDDSADRIDTTAVEDRIMTLAETDEERVVLRLMLDGERETPVFAEALRLTELPPREQTKAVQKIKDRLDKRRRRRFPEGWQDGRTD